MELIEIVDMEARFEIKVNSQQRSIVTDSERTLLDVLREDLHLTGTKYGCGEGRCGACTVIVNGKKEHSCLLKMSEVNGATILTIEGLANGDKLHPVQEAFLQEEASQCGYCTPGMIMTTVALLKEKPKPSDKEIIEWFETSICRCCGYPRILKAVKKAAELGGGKV